MARSASVGFTIFVGVGIFEDAQVGVVARLGYESVLESFEHGAVGLVGVSAVVETAVCSYLEYLWEEVRGFVFVHLDGAESSYTRSVDKVTALFARQLEHL